MSERIALLLQAHGILRLSRGQGVLRVDVYRRAEDRRSFKIEFVDNVG